MTTPSFDESRRASLPSAGEMAAAWRRHTLRGRAVTLSEAIGRRTDPAALPGTTRFFAHALYREIPLRLADPEGMVAVAALGESLVAFALVTGLSTVAVVASTGLRSVAAVVLSAVVAWLVVRVQRRNVRSVAVSPHRRLRAVESTLATLLLVGVVLIPLIAAIRFAPFDDNVDGSALVRLLGATLLPLPLLLAVSDVWAAGALPRPGEDRSTRVLVHPPQRFDHHNHWVVPGLRGAQRARPRPGQRLAFRLAVLGGMSPTGTLRHDRLWVPFTTRGSLVVGATLLNGTAAFGFAVMQARTGPWVAIPFALAWALAVLLTERHALRLRDLRATTRSLLVLTRALAAVECLLVGLGTGLALLGAAQLIAVEQFAPGEGLWSHLSTVSAAGLLLGAAIPVLPLVRVPGHEAARQMYESHQHLVDRAREEALSCRPDPHTVDTRSFHEEGRTGA
jgi:hypothetical protein